MLARLRLLRTPPIVQSTPFNATSGGQNCHQHEFHIITSPFLLRRKELDDKKIDCSCERCSDGSEAETGFAIPMMAMLMATLVLLMDIVIRSD